MISSVARAAELSKGHYVAKRETLKIFGRV